jgi:pimeloyl-ACP methyl ester carboxylesterase
LSWTTTATGILLFSVERRTTTGVYSQISQPAATSTSFDDSGLSGSTTYLYRMRVQTGAGFSPYSNEVTVTTLQALPAAPTNLQATAISSSQVNLAWTNNALDAIAVRVESQPAGSANFSDVGAAATLSSASITNLQPNTAYSFRVRAQNAAGYSAYSNVATATTLPVPKTVFLIHGIGQGSFDMQGLYGSLIASSGIDLARFRVDPGFDFSECADTDFCSSSCSISAGAQKLAQYIANANPPGDIILIGFSMGGLIARDLMANGRLILNGRKISALITLGTPNLGYPYTLVDTAKFCTPLVQQMDGNWRSQQSTNSVVLSPYLLSLTNQWPSTSYPGSPGLWLAASGRQCSNAVRTINATTGCRDRNPYSDGVVCDDSATYFVTTPSGTGPNRYWQDPGQIYVHSNTVWGIGTSVVLCGNSGNPAVNPPLSNPPSFGPLFAAIKGLINGL